MSVVKSNTTKSMDANKLMINARIVCVVLVAGAFNLCISPSALLGSESPAGVSAKPADLILAKSKAVLSGAAEYYVEIKSTNNLAKTPSKMVCYYSKQKNEAVRSLIRAEMVSTLVNEEGTWIILGAKAIKNPGIGSDSNAYMADLASFSSEWKSQIEEHVVFDGRECVAIDYTRDENEKLQEVVNRERLRLLNEQASSGQQRSSVEGPVAEIIKRPLPVHFIYYFEASNLLPAGQKAFSSNGTLISESVTRYHLGPIDPDQDVSFEIPPNCVRYYPKNHQEFIGILKSRP